MIAGFVTRADAGLVRPRSVSRNIDPFGSAIHYGGPAQNIRSHDDCLKRWKAWQNYHMNTLGWVDLAYSGGFCQHGYAFAGRGFGIRTAANGTNHGNYHYYAWCWIGGQGEHPTDKALDAAAWWVAEARKAGGAGPDVQPHSAFKSTSCPGPLTAQLGTITSRASHPAPERYDMNPDLVVYARRGVDFDSASAIVNSRGGRAVPVLDRGLAQEALDNGVKVVALGGPAANDLRGEVEAVGLNALDSLIKGAQAAR